jgi:hypothetical protein
MTLESDWQECNLAERLKWNELWDFEVLLTYGEGRPGECEEQSAYRLLIRKHGNEYSWQVWRGEDDADDILDEGMAFSLEEAKCAAEASFKELTTPWERFSQRQD